MNPILEKLGLSANSKAVVFHADDIGSLQATIPAYRNLVRRGSISSASVMVPCPWFPAAAQVIRETAALPQSDIGVHLTHTSEWDAFRWGPISAIGRDPNSNLLDKAGYFHQQTGPVQANGKVEAVTAEIEAQIERALDPDEANIDVTHIDTHMGTMMHPRFLPSYVATGFKYRIPIFAIRLTVDLLRKNGYDEETAERFAANSEMVEAEGMPLFNGFGMLPLREKSAFRDRLEHARRTLEEAPAGLYYFIIHPAVDSPELRGTAPDWEARVMDYTLFMSDTWQKMVEASGINVISMRQLRNLMRA